MAFQNLINIKYANPKNLKVDKNHVNIFSSNLLDWISDIKQAKPLHVIFSKIIGCKTTMLR